MSRYLKRYNTEGLLVVGQLWVWILAPDLIITGFPHIEQYLPIQQSALFTRILERIYSRIAGLVRGVQGLAHVIIEQGISSCDRNFRRQRNADYFDVFKFSTTGVLEAQIKLFSEFQETSIAVSNWMIGALRKPTSNPIKHLAFVEDLLTVRHEIDLLVGARDIQDELTILKHVLKDQVHVIREMQRQRVSGFDVELNDLIYQMDDIAQVHEWMQSVSASITAPP